jgi:hypothetical protein
MRNQFQSVKKSQELGSIKMAGPSLNSISEGFIKQVEGAWPANPLTRFARAKVPLETLDMDLV